MRTSSQIRSFRIGYAKKRHCGFTLVELMVSLLIGLVIVLGATQLFMVSRESFKDVEILGSKQNILNYSVDVLSRDIRRATFAGPGGEERDDENRLCIEIVDIGISSETIEREYFLEKTNPSDKDSLDYSLKVKSGCDDDGGEETSVLVNGFLKNGLTVTKLTPAGLMEIKLGLDNDGDDIIFRVMNRTKALSSGEDDTLPPDCYTPSEKIKGKCK